MNIMNWDEHQRQLERLAARGFSAADIAERMSRSLGRTITRNAVIGRCNRTGVELKPDPARVSARVSAGIRRSWAQSGPERAERLRQITADPDVRRRMSEAARAARARRREASA